MEAGLISLEFRGRLSSIEINYKNRKDLVTEADIAVEKFIIDKIADKYPDHGVLGEESGNLPGNEYRWIIDPIDGTASFVHNQPFYSISVALERSGRTILAAVNVPVMNELFEAQAGCGATLNGESIRASKESSMIDSMLGTGFACCREDLEHNNLPYFNRITPIIRGVRRYGSAAADLCYVACGRLDGFWELNLNIYDVAAGFLIVSEAGGRNSDFTGGQECLYHESVSTNGLIHDELIATLSKVKQEVLNS